MLGSAMTSVSLTGRYVTYQEKMQGLLFATCINLSKRHPDNIQTCRFDGTSTRVIVNDRQGNLVRVGIEQPTYSQVTKSCITHFYCHNENTERVLAVEWSKGQSRLLSINQISKKEDHMTNLNMRRIVGFAVNCIRDLILVMESGLLALVDIKTKKEYKSLKSVNEKFIHSCFTADNKSVLLINNVMKVSVINIADMKVHWSMVLPMQFEKAKLHVSYDNKWAIVTGNFPGMYLLELFADRPPVSSKIQLPTQVKHGKFTLQGDFIFIGRDQIVYLFSVYNNPDKVYELFNFEHHKPINCFDVSVDLKYLVAVSNYGNIYVFNFREALRKIKVKEGAFRETPIFWINDAVAKEVDYNPLDKSFQVEQPNKNTDRESPPIGGTLRDKSTHNQFQDFDNIPHLSISQQDEQEFNQVLPIPSDIQEKQQLTRSFYRLKQYLNKARFFQDYTNEVIQILYAFHRMFSVRKANSISGFFLNWIMSLRKNVRELSLALCPQLLTFITRKLDMDFHEFITQSMASLYLDYFNKEDWLRIIKFFIQNSEKPSILLVFFLKVLLVLEKKILKCEYEADLFEILTSEKGLNLQKIMEQVLHMYDMPRYRLVLAIKNNGEKLKKQSMADSDDHQHSSSRRPEQCAEALANYTQQSEDIAQKNAKIVVEGIGASKLEDLLNKNERLKGKLESIANLKYNLVNTFN